MTIFEHHFIHLVKLCKAGCSRLEMPETKTSIFSLDGGFGEYTYDNYRARNLPSAIHTIKEPDEVYGNDQRLETADHVFLKRFDSLPYEYTVVLVKNDSGALLPITSHPVRRRRIKQFQGGELIYQKTK